MPKRDWQHLVETALTVRYSKLSAEKTKLLARYVPLKAFGETPKPEFLYTSGRRGRCNPGGVHCVYFGEGPDTARAEFDSYYQSPITEMGFNVVIFQMLVQDPDFVEILEEKSVRERWPKL